MRDWGKEAIHAASLGFINIDSKPDPGEIRDTRDTMGLSQSELGLVLGVSQSQIVLWEKGLYKIPLGVLGRLRMIKAGVIEIPERYRKPLSIRKIKDDTMEKLRSYGHETGYWKRDGATWVFTCDNPYPDPCLAAMGHNLPFPCGFEVRIMADRTVVTNRPWGECLGEKII